MVNSNRKIDTPSIGILKWESGFEITLSQLEKMPGNIMHPSTFGFPVLFQQVKGACSRTIVREPSQQILEASIQGAKALELAGVKIISASCGFWGIFQKELANAVDIPVCTNSLLQVPVVAQMLKKGDAIGILTANKKYLTAKHLEQAGISKDLPIFIGGIEDTEEFYRIHVDSQAEVDVVKFQKEVLEVATDLVVRNPTIKAIVIECTDLPPCSPEIRKVLGLPVFDYVTLVNWLYSSLSTKEWPSS